MKFFKGYSHLTKCKVGEWKFPIMGCFKCNFDMISKGNLGPNFWFFFCIRDREANLVYVVAQKHRADTILEYGTIALRRGLEHCISQNFLPMTLEIDLV